jgi:hypothetical protein
MSAPDPNPAERPLLFPDPVIEYYMERVDRAAIRERLKMTPEERLEALQHEADKQAAEHPPRVREEPPNEPAPPLKFYGEEFQPAPSKVPMLFPDPVIEAYMQDVDRTLIREQLKKDATGRLQTLIAMAEFWDEARKSRLRKRNGRTRN